MLILELTHHVANTQFDCLKLCHQIWKGLGALLLYRQVQVHSRNLLKGLVWLITQKVDFAQCLDIRCAMHCYLRLQHTLDKSQTIFLIPAIC